MQRLELPEALNSLEGVVAGSNHTLVFGRDSLGKPLLFACGLNFYGQLGLGDKNDRISLQPVTLPECLNSLEGIAAGGLHTLVFGRDSNKKPLLFACGWNNFGQLGLGDKNDRSSLHRIELPEALNSLEGVVASFNDTFVFGFDSFGEPALFACGVEHLLTTVPKPVICDSEKYRLKVAIENHVQTLTNEFSWFGLKKSPQEKIKMLKQLCENLEQVDNRNSKQKLSDTMSTFLNEHKQTIKEHRNPFRNWGFFRPESPTRSETFLTEKMNSLNS
ncbi:hypothetical protein Lwal_2973 [Legionella waltersii]|uniref:UVB-resistance protein UVR8 n=1 Tax=Legionella waltersii TaxID=66969 RepID=A0A0W1A0S9_9GAMM|nr:hypothetical protein Lwal_2973 [Legionella waltersii]